MAAARGTSAAASRFLAHTQSTASFSPRGPPPPQPAHSPDRGKETGYQFPVGRALRYVHRGRRIYARRDGEEYLSALIEECFAAPVPTRAGKNRSTTLSRSWEAEVDDGGADGWGEASLEPVGGGAAPAAERAWSEEASSLGSASDALDDQQVEAARRFAQYHCHHVLVSFKKTRAAWKAADHSKQDQAGCRSTFTASTSSATSGAPSSSFQSVRSADEIVALMRYVFEASVLLHLSGLFGVGDKYVESMLEVCFSASVMLSQAVQHMVKRKDPGQQGDATATTVRRRDGGGRHRRAHRGGGVNGIKAAPPSPPLEQLLRPHSSSSANAVVTIQEGWNSLHWAVVHYCEGVRLWGLLDYGQPLFPPDRARVPFVRLVQATASLLTSFGSPALPRERWLQCAALCQSHSKARATAQWFGEEDPVHRGANATHTHGVVADAAPAVSAFMQQRRLQALPLLWLSLLSTYVHRTMTAAPPRARGASDGAAFALPVLTWRCPRHAFLRLLPLFGGEAKGERLLWSLALVLYTGAGRNPASHVELAAMLSVMERYTVTIPGDPQQNQAGLLSEWHTSSHRPVRCNTVSRGQLQLADSPLSSPSAPSSPPAIQNATALYAAIVRIPLGGLGQSSAHASTPSSTPRLSFQFINELLLRILLQWRTTAAHASDAEALFRSRVTRVAVNSTADSEDEEERRQRKEYAVLAAVSRSVEELVQVLAAAQHLRQLHHCVRDRGNAKPTQGGSDEDAPVAACDDDASASASVALLSTTEMVMRALTEQVGSVILPPRVRLLESYGVAVTDKERAVLQALHAVVEDVLLHRPTTRPKQPSALPFPSSVEDVIKEEAAQPETRGGVPGTVPSAYYTTMNRLLR